MNLDGRDFSGIDQKTAGDAAEKRQTAEVPTISDPVAETITDVLRRAGVETISKSPNCDRRVKRR